MKQFLLLFFHVLLFWPFLAFAQNPSPEPMLLIEEQPVWNLNMVVELKGKKADDIIGKLISYINAVGVVNGPILVETADNVRLLSFRGEFFLGRGHLDFSALIKIKDERYKVCFWNLCHNTIKINQHRAILNGSDAMPASNNGCFPDLEGIQKGNFEKNAMNTINEFTHNLNLHMTNPKSTLNNNTF
jgi:hypothetical protein